MVDTAAGAIREVEAVGVVLNSNLMVPQHLMVDRDLPSTTGMSPSHLNTVENKTSYYLLVSLYRVFLVQSRKFGFIVLTPGETVRSVAFSRGNS